MNVLDKVKELINEELTATIDPDGNVLYTTLLDAGSQTLGSREYLYPDNITFGGNLTDEREINRLHNLLMEMETAKGCEQSMNCLFDTYDEVEANISLARSQFGATPIATPGSGLDDGSGPKVRADLDLMKEVRKCGLGEDYGLSASFHYVDYSGCCNSLLDKLSLSDKFRDKHIDKGQPDIGFEQIYKLVDDTRVINKWKVQGGTSERPFVPIQPVSDASEIKHLGIHAVGWINIPRIWTFPDGSNLLYVNQITRRLAIKTDGSGPDAYEIKLTRRSNGDVSTGSGKHGTTTWANIETVPEPKTNPPAVDQAVEDKQDEWFRIEIVALYDVHTDKNIDLELVLERQRGWLATNSTWTRNGFVYPDASSTNPETLLRDIRPAHQHCNWIKQYNGSIIVKDIPTDDESLFDEADGNMLLSVNGKGVNCVQAYYNVGAVGDPPIPNTGAFHYILDDGLNPSHSNELKIHLDEQASVEVTNNFSYLLNFTDPTNTRYYLTDLGKSTDDIGLTVADETCRCISDVENKDAGSDDVVATISGGVNEVKDDLTKQCEGKCSEPYEFQEAIHAEVVIDYNDKNAGPDFTDITSVYEITDFGQAFSDAFPGQDFDCMVTEMQEACRVECTEYKTEMEAVATTLQGLSQPPDVDEVASKIAALNDAQRNWLAFIRGTPETVPLGSYPHAPDPVSEQVARVDALGATNLSFILNLFQEPHPTACNYLEYTAFSTLAGMYPTIFGSDVTNWYPEIPLTGVIYPLSPNWRYAITVGSFTENPITIQLPEGTNNHEKYDVYVNYVLVTLTNLGDGTYPGGSIELPPSNPKMLFVWTTCSDVIPEESYCSTGDPITTGDILSSYRILFENNYSFDGSSDPGNFNGNALLTTPGSESMIHVPVGVEDIGSTFFNLDFLTSVLDADFIDPASHFTFINASTSNSFLWTVLDFTSTNFYHNGAGEPDISSLKQSLENNIDCDGTVAGYQACPKGYQGLTSDPAGCDFCYNMIPSSEPFDPFAGIGQGDLTPQTFQSLLQNDPLGSSPFLCI